MTMNILDNIHLTIMKMFHDYWNNSFLYQLHVTIMKTFHNYLIISLISPTQLHDMKRQINMCLLIIEFS
jgi:hypothetical protein